MDWRDVGFVLGARPHGETAAVLEAMTREHGRHPGLVHGGRGRRLRPVLQPGNSLDLTWRARSDDALGTYAVEPLDARAGRLMESPLALHAIGAVAALLRLLPERDPHPGLHDAALVVLDHAAEPAFAGPLMVSFELQALAELGFGLDLASCALTGTREDLTYVSPRTGRAVSRGAAGIYADRLLRLPPFLVEGQGRRAPTAAEVADGLRLTGHFLTRHAYEPRGMALPEARERFAATLAASAGEG